MNKEDKIILLSQELLDCKNEKDRVLKIIDLFSDETIVDPGFYTPLIGSNRDFLLEAMDSKILWLEQKIKEIEAE